jgi:hypothetical protein
MGTVGTPVIDVGTGILYVVARTVGSKNGWTQRLHALDIVTGSERLGGPVTISAVYLDVALTPHLITSGQP